MASMPPPEKQELLCFSYNFLRALLNTLTEEQIGKILLQEKVLEKVPAYGPETFVRLYFQIVKERELQEIEF